MVFLWADKNIYFVRPKFIKDCRTNVVHIEQVNAFKERKPEHHNVFVALTEQ